MKVEIKIYPPVHGRRWIMVDNEPWGIIEMTRYGQYGSSYTFRHVGGDPIRFNGAKGFQISGDRLAERQAKRAPGGDPVIIRPLQQRMQEAAEMLVRNGCLRSPATIAAERAAEKQRQEAERDAQEHARRQKFIEVANNVIQPIEGLLLPPRECHDERAQLVERIIAAMKWAQTQ